jgi:hypothetical protein
MIPPKLIKGARVAKKSSKNAMSDEHKAALAQGRAEGKAVRDYLEALAQEKQAGRRQDPETLQKKISDAQDRIDAEGNPAKRLELIQRRLDLEEQLAAQGEEVDLEQLEKDFIKSIPGYAERKGITYTALREAGVPASVLKQAGIKRTRKAA